MKQSDILTTFILVFLRMGELTGQDDAWVIDESHNSLAKVKIRQKPLLLVCVPMTGKVIDHLLDWIRGVFGFRFRFVFFGFCVPMTDDWQSDWSSPRLDWIRGVVDGVFGFIEIWRQTGDRPQS